MTTFTDFLSNSQEVTQYGNWLAELYIEDSDGNQVVPDAPNNGSAPQAVGLRVSSREDQGFRTLPTDTVPNEIYYDRLVEGLQLQASIWGNDVEDHSLNNGNTDSTNAVTVGGSSLPTTAQLILDNRDGYYDQYSPSNGYAWDGKSCIVRFGRGFGDNSTPYFMSIDDFRPFYFLMGEPSFGLDRVVVPLYGLDRRFDHPITTLFYRGTGYCLNFAAGSYSEHGSPSKLNITGDLTITAWVKLDNITNNRVILGWTTSTRLPFRMTVTSAGRFRFSYTHSTGTSVNLDTTATVGINKWYQLGVRISGTSIQLIIYDHTTGIETIQSFTQAAASRDSSTGTFQISLNSATLSTVGRVDEVRVYNDDLTLAQIRTGRIGEVETVPANLKGYWKLNDATGSTVADDGDGTAADGTLNGSTSWLHSLEGDLSLAGYPKPDRYGRSQYRLPILVDPINLIYQVAAGSVESISVHEGLASLTSDGNQSNEKFFIASTVTNDFITHLEGGYFKLKSPNTLKLTASVEGYNDGGYISKKGQLIREIITTRGPNPLTDPDDLNTSSFTQIDTDDAAIHGIAINSAIDIREVVDKLIGPAYFWGYPFDSQLFTVGKWTGPAGSASLTIPSHRILEGPEPLENLLRAWRVLLGYGKIEPHEESDISASVKGTELYQRGLLNEGWSLSTSEDKDVLDLHELARARRFDTQYQYPTQLSDVAGRQYVGEEAERILQLYSSDWEVYRLKVDATGLQLDLNDTVAPVVEQKDSDGNVTYRLGFDGTRMMNVVAIVFNLDWTVELTLVG